MQRQVSKKLIASGKWLTLSQIQYVSHDGTTRIWETAGRKESRSAVGILATFKNTGEIVLIRQYRPPLDRFVIEFPAGLIDPGETPAEAALRELKEETGYTGKIIRIFSNTYPSPGMSEETISLVRMVIDPAEQKDLRTDFDDSESIETFIVNPAEASLFLEEAVKRGDVIDSKVQAFFTGLCGLNDPE